jgi:hypothetical protein
LGGEEYPFVGEMYSSLYTGELGLTPPASLKEGMEPEVADDSSGGVRGGTTPACHRAGILRLSAAAAVHHKTGSDGHWSGARQRRLC